MQFSRLNNNELNNLPAGQRIKTLAEIILQLTEKLKEEARKKDGNSRINQKTSK